MRPTKEQVWQAITSNRDSANGAPEGSPLRVAMRPFFEGSVDALEGQFESAVTVEAIAHAKVTFLRYCLTHSFGASISPYLPMDVSASEVDAILDEVATRLEVMLAIAPTYPQGYGLTEEDAMLGKQVRLCPEAQEKWREGTLTIGELLAMQADVVLKNNISI